MYKVFDYYNQFEKANITLCNPTKIELYPLNMARDVKMKLRYNALSELSFIIDQKTNDIPNPAYDYVQSKRLVHIEGFGYYIITEPSEDTSTQTPFKEVKALSLEAELINKKVSALKGTFKFYDLLQPEDTPGAGRRWGTLLAPVPPEGHRDDVRTVQAKT